MQVLPSGAAAARPQTRLFRVRGNAEIVSKKGAASIAALTLCSGAVVEVWEEMLGSVAGL